ncbi:DUF1697 domain-containing protein [Luteimicrobium album]|nr:DUF1697 domain-containing protein [Luteimicrobium album]
MATSEADGRWVVLLRGVNVGGVTIRSADLRACVEGLGFTGVRTVLASGNVVVDATGEAVADAKRRIEAGLGERFGYDAWVVLVPQPELAAVVDAFPWPSREGWHDYVTFVSEPEALDELLAAADALRLDPATDPVGGGEGSSTGRCRRVAPWTPRSRGCRRRPGTRRRPRRATRARSAGCWAEDLHHAPPLTSSRRNSVPSSAHHRSDDGLHHTIARPDGVIDQTRLDLGFA